MPKKETQSQLAARLAAAAQHVTVGARYAHYKQPGHSYQVLTLALREEDNEPCVVYQAEYGQLITFVRPVASWIEEVEVEGRAVKRFTKITANDPAYLQTIRNARQSQEYLSHEKVFGNL